MGRKDAKEKLIKNKGKEDVPNSLNAATVIESLNNGKICRKAHIYCYKSDRAGRR